MVPESATSATSAAVAMRRIWERLKLLLLAWLGDLDTTQLFGQAAVQQVGGTEQSEGEDGPELAGRQTARVRDHHTVVGTHRKGEEAHVVIVPLIGVIPDEVEAGDARERHPAASA